LRRLAAEGYARLSPPAADVSAIMPQRRWKLLHAIHDFLPRHQAGSEIYAFELCRELSSRHHVTMMSADYDPLRRHGQVTWRVHAGLPVLEIVNNWVCASFEETYRPPLIGERLASALEAVQPDILHVHNLLNLSFELPIIAHAHGVPVVATLHDYTLVCPSGGQRLHQAEQHVCDIIETARCARCFPQSPFAAQMSFGTLAGPVARPGLAQWAALTMRRRLPVVASRVARVASRVGLASVTEEEISARLATAQEVFRQVDLFVAPSESIATEFERLGMDRSKIRVSDYGCAPLAQRSRPEPHARLRIGFVGTLVWHKGVHVLLDAVRRLPASTWELRIFGGLDVFPEYATDLRARAAGLPVQFMGRFDRDRTAEMYADMDVLVVPSLWLENSPLVIHEAFMAGVPVIGARIGGIPGLVQDGWNGLLYDPRSPEQLSAALRQLIEQPDRLLEFAGRLPRVKSIAQDASEWEAIYAEVLDRHAAGGRAE